jgi:hypothetical protein
MIREIELEKKNFLRADGRGRRDFGRFFFLGLERNNRPVLLLCINIHSK